MSEIQVYQKILGRNDKLARQNSKALNGAYCINIMSSPGAGKTTLLEKTLKAIGKKYLIGVIEGDISTSNDAKRLRKYARPGTVFQIETENFGGGCHLDAGMVSNGLRKIKAHKKKYDLIIIENVGNLICPADFNLGEHEKVVMLSVTEGDDKPLKYPVIFKAAGLVIISKTDLIKHTDFSMKKAVKNVRKINRKTHILEMSSYKSLNFEKWIDFLVCGINLARG
jgi:hydrogenase nickel incorporation protein HypB